jgi:hypothetical protein
MSIPEQHGTSICTMEIDFISCFVKISDNLSTYSSIVRSSLGQKIIKTLLFKNR